MRARLWRFFLTGWRIHLFYLKAQARMPELFPQGEKHEKGVVDVPGCAGSITWNSIGRRYYPIVCSCDDLEFLAAVKEAIKRQEVMLDEGQPV